MIAKHTFLILMMSVGALTSVKAQDTVTMDLKACMRYAVEHSTKMRIAQADNRDAQIDRRDAILAAFTPTIEGSTYAYSNFGRSIDPETNTYIRTTSFHNGYSLSAGINLFNGFQAINNLKITKTAQLMGLTKEQQTKDQICLATMEAYCNVLYYTEMQKALQGQVATAEKAVQLATRQEQLGQKSHADVVLMSSVGESVLMVVIALGLAVAVVTLFRQSTLAALIETPLNFGQNWGVVALTIGLALLISVVASLYPALFATSFNPAFALKGALGTTQKGKAFRIGLIGLQFTVSIVLIICAVFVHQQRDFMMNHDMGFNQENLLQSHVTWELANNRETVENQLKTDADIKDIAWGDGGADFGDV